MDPRLEQVVTDVLGDGPATLEALHRQLTRSAPALAVRGPRWLAWSLLQHPRVRFDGQRYELGVTGEEDFELEIQEARAPERSDVVALRRCVAFDVETNADRVEVTEHEIIELGAVRLVDGEVVDRYHELVAPTRKLSPTTTRVTGITDRDLDGAVSLDEALGRFAAFVGDDPLVAHNGLGYDFLVLDAAFAGCELDVPAGIRLDSLHLAHLIVPRAGDGLSAGIDGTRPAPGRSLDQLAAHLGVTAGGETHRADADAALLAAVLQALMERLIRADPVARAVRWVLRQVSHPWIGLEVAVCGSSTPVDPDRPSLLAILPDLEPFDEPLRTGTLDVDRAVAPLRPGGVLLEGRAHRPAQVEMAERVARSLAAQGSRPLMLEAPTGTGKTFAYLLPAVAAARAWGEPVIIATHSKVLQNQVLTALEELRPATGDIASVLLKGKENYLSLEALDGVLDELAPDPDEAVALAIILAWAAETPTGEWDDLRTWAINHTLPALDRLRWQLRVESSSTVAGDDLAARCFYRYAVSSLADAEIGVLNHAVLVSRNDWLDHTGRLVLDEAHNLEEAATTALTQEVTEHLLQRSLDAVHDPARRWGTVARWCDATGTSLRHESPRAVLEAVRLAAAAASQLRVGLIEFLRERAGARRAEVERFGASVHLQRFERRRTSYGQVRAAAVSTARALRGVADALQELEVPEQLRGRYRRRRLEEELMRTGRRLRELASGVYETVLAPDEDDDTWICIADLRIEHGVYTWGLRRVPMTVAPRLRELWNQLDAAVLTSATMRVNGSFEYLQRELGLEAAKGKQLETPFDGLAEQELVWLTDHLPSPTGGLMDAFTTAQSDELARLLLLARGRTLALFAARSRLEHARSYLQPLLQTHGLTVHAQGQAPAPALIEEMRSDVHCSLLATRSFWEGVDIPGEALSLLVIEKLPFDSPAEPVLGARMRHLEDAGRDPFTELLVPRAAIRFAQGVGRLIRTAQDRGAVVVLDKRLRRPTGYREAFLDSLPGPPTFVWTSDADAGYAALADHLGVPFDDELRAVLGSLPSSDRWAFLDELQLSDEEATDPQTVTARLEQVRRRMELDPWRPGQLETMLRLIAGQDVMAILPTGSGKSLTFQLPALLRPGLTLVISPLIALMRDQVRQLRARGITRVADLSSGRTQSEQEEILAGTRSGAIRLLYVSPERLWSQRFRTALSEVQVARVVVDEAHCVSEWGHSFRPEYGAIPDAVREIVGAAHRRPSVSAMTATATPQVRDEVVELLELPAIDPVVADPNRPELVYHVVDCEDIEDRELTLVRVVEAFRAASVIVYVPRQKDATELAALLRAANHRARGYHGGMDGEERTHVEEAFSDGELDVVVATKAFGLGIDKPDIAAVVHLEMPSSVEEYVQETGRAARGARAGMEPRTGACILLRTPRDCGIHRTFIRYAAPGLEAVRAAYGAIGARYVGPVDSLVPDEQIDAEQLELAVSYLVRSGAVRRHQDIAWRGRVRLPADARRALDRIADSEPDAAERGRAMLAAVESVGQEDYYAPVWASRLNQDPEAIEEGLLDLSRRGVLAFASWETAWQLTTTGVRPDWSALQGDLNRRRKRVEELSANAKAYRSQDLDCRRSWLLSYLGADDIPAACDGCDVCRFDLPRPWEDIAVDRDDLAGSVPPQFAVLDVSARLSEHRYGRNMLKRVLLGEPVQFHPHLAEDPGYGSLRVLGEKRVEMVIEQLVVDGLLETVTIEREERTYEGVRPTAEGMTRLN